jgi:quinol-cytochrome oxidoreductase complex cytochrome b subunit
MKRVVRQTMTWLDQRTGIQTAVRRFLYEEIPASSGWPQVFGGVALFLFLSQALTGILLTFNYAPTPGDAYNSLNYIIREVTAGRMIHAFHHWGASVMVVVVVFHMGQVLLYGAYKKPRETTWIVGVLLLLLTLGFGLTGYLLPWDNRAYWGTVVTTKIAAQAPIIGAYLEWLMGAENGVGVATFARFYSLHVLVFPALTGILIAIHVYLVRRHGITPAPAEARPPRKFYPEQAFKDAVAVFVAFAFLFGMAVLAKVPLDRLADPTDTTAVPRPEWYFLFLFEILKFFQAALEPIGSVLLPTLAILFLFALPFLDRRPLRVLSERKVAAALVALGLVSWAALTAAAVITTPKPTAPAIALPSTRDWTRLSPEELAGVGYFRQEQCGSCHNLVDGEPKPGPNLATVTPRKPADWMIAHFKNPSQVIPGSNMPPIHLTDAQLNALSSLLLRLAPENAVSVFDAPAAAVRGAGIYVTNGCGSCHKVNGMGADIGPSLNGVASRRTADWVEKHFANPAAFSPGSVMPSFQFSPEDERALVQYLFSLPAGQ